jgi:lipopolysaccharide transport system permease protein
MNLTHATISGPHVDQLQSSPPAAAADVTPTPTAPETEILPVGGWHLINFAELWQSRELVLILVWRDVMVRYKQTFLGAAWAVLQPALMMIVFTLVFGQMAHMPTDGAPYPIFVYAGLLPWTLFATGVTNGANSVIGSERLITKIYFPRLALPFASVGAPVVDFVVALGLLLVMMLYYRISPGLTLLLVPLLLLLVLLAALGIGTLLAGLNVYYRDFRHVVPYLVQLGMFATPTIYMQPNASSGKWFSLVLILNPMMTFISAFRAAVLGSRVPWYALGLASLWVVVVFLLACFLFRKLEDGFADTI